jgi:hypothetical protein
MKGRWVLLAVLAIGAAAAGAAGEPAAATGLTGLDDKLSSTGRIGVYTPRSSSQIAPGVAPPTSDRDSASRGLQPVAPGRAKLSVPVERPAGLSEEEFTPSDGRVAACRVEVARRRQVEPKKLAAKEVVLRFNVEADGHVHDAEAVSALDTDLEIAACAKRVLSEWVFAKHRGEAFAVERTYRFR